MNPTLAKLSKSIALASLIICTNTHASSKNDRTTSELKTQIALEYIKIGNLDSAKIALDEALQKHPNNSTATMAMAITYQLVGTKESMQTAEVFFKKAIQQDPTNAQIRNNYGQYLFVNERYLDAIEEFKVSANTIGYINRDNSLNNLAQSYLKLNNLTDAKFYFLRSLQINPRIPEALLGLTETHYLLDEIEEATDVLNDYITLVGKQKLDDKGLWLAIKIHKQNGDAIALREYAKTLTEKYPKSPEYKKYIQQKDSNNKWL